MTTCLLYLKSEYFIRWQFGGSFTLTGFPKHNGGIFPMLNFPLAVRRATFAFKSLAYKTTCSLIAIVLEVLRRGHRLGSPPAMNILLMFCPALISVLMGTQPSSGFRRSVLQCSYASHLGCVSRTNLIHSANSLDLKVYHENCASCDLACFTKIFILVKDQI